MQQKFRNVIMSIRFTVTETLFLMGALNGVNPSQIVTLNGSQTIPGTTTFRHLEITQALNVCFVHFISATCI